MPEAFGSSRSWYAISLRRSQSLQFHHVGCLRSTVALRDFEFNRLTFFQGFEAVALDRREVNEHVVAFFYGNEAVAFLCVKPLNCSSQMKNLLKISPSVGEWSHYNRIYAKLQYVPGQ